MEITCSLTAQVEGELPAVADVGFRVDRPSLIQSTLRSFCFLKPQVLVITLHPWPLQAGGLGFEGKSVVASHCMASCPKPYTLNPQP